jgi:trehalose synthase
MAQFAQPLPHPQFLVPPSIDPLSGKNMDLSHAEIEAVRSEYGLDPSRPLLVQISRFDRFKDPVGVVEAYRLVRKVAPVQLVLAGGSATDDPEGKAILEDVIEAAGNDPDIHVLLLPPDSHKTVNALQRMATIILQKSTKEGFGLTVTEGMWKGKPVIGGDVGGIRIQVVNHQTGFLVNTPEGAAHRIRYLLHHQESIERMGTTAREFVRENFLLTRHIREYLTLMLVTLRDIKANVVNV